MMLSRCTLQSFLTDPRTMAGRRPGKVELRQDKPLAHLSISHPAAQVPQLAIAQQEGPTILSGRNRLVNGDATP